MISGRDEMIPGYCEAIVGGCAWNVEAGCNAGVVMVIWHFWFGRPDRVGSNRKTHGL
jgi:hypothetical protein